MNLKADKTIFCFDMKELQWESYMDSSVLVHMMIVTMTMTKMTKPVMMTKENITEIDIDKKYREHVGSSLEKERRALERLERSSPGEKDYDYDYERLQCTMGKLQWGDGIRNCSLSRPF